MYSNSGRGRGASCSTMWSMRVSSREAADNLVTQPERRLVPLASSSSESLCWRPLGNLTDSVLCDQKWVRVLFLFFGGLNDHLMQELLWQAANTWEYEKKSVETNPTKYAPQRQVWTQTGPGRRRCRSERKEEVTKRWDQVDHERILYAVVRRDPRVERWHAVSCAQPSCFNHTDRRTSKPSSPERPWCVWIPGKPVRTAVCGAQEQRRR